MKKKIISDCLIEKSALYGLSDITKLLNILGVLSEEKLIKFCDDSNYSVYPIYKTVNGQKKKRIVEAPNKELKKIQSAFVEILQCIVTPAYVHAGRKNMSYIQNAKVHINCNDMLCTDIRKFYPHTKKEYLINFLINDLKITSKLAKILGELLTYKGHLPTGAPSSQLLTFWSYKKTFDNLYEFCKSEDITMTLYVDDMTFSSKTKITNKLLPLIIKEIKKVNLEIHPKKIKRFNNTKYKHVTGVCITKKHELKIPNSKGYEVIEILKKYNNDLDGLTQKDKLKLIGEIRAVQQIEPKKFQKTLEKVLLKVAND